MKFFSWCKKWIIDFLILNIIKLSFICFLLYITFVFATEKNNTGTIIFAGFTLFFILFFWSSKFEIVELLGAKFKLKELKNSINELKELTKTMAKISLDIIQSKNRMGSGDKEKEQEFFEEINSILDNVNVKKEEKETIYSKYWYSWIIWDYFSLIYGQIRDALRGNDNEWVEFDKNFRKLHDYNNKDKHNPAFLKELLLWAKNNKVQEYDWSNIEEQISDFEYYMQNKQFKNFTRWQELNKDE